MTEDVYDSARTAARIGLAERLQRQAKLLDAMAQAEKNPDKRRYLEAHLRFVQRPLAER